MSAMLDRARGGVTAFRCAAATFVVAVSLLAAAPAAWAAPANDDFFDALVLSGDHVSRADDNIDATKEPLEPNHAGNEGGASIWYSWTAPASNPVHIDSCFTSLDTLLGVYTGDSVSNLTEIASNDDGAGCLGSVVDFSAQAGTTYRIAIDGYNGAMGEIRFMMSQHAPYPQCKDGACDDSRDS